MASTTEVLRLSFSPTAAVLVAFAAPVLIVLWYAAAYFLDPHGLRSYPGPLLAKFSDAWLINLARQGNHCEVLTELHKKHGTFVRIAPNHLSIASPNALPSVYGHSTGMLKSDYYDAFVSFGEGSIFSTRSRNAHTRKRKIVSHMFAPRSVKGFEKRVHHHTKTLVRRWDELCDFTKVSGKSGEVGSCHWRSAGGRVWFDSMIWFNFLAFDIIGELAFGTPFGMLLSARDSAPVVKVSESGLATMVKTPSSTSGLPPSEIEMDEIPAVKTINARGEYFAFLGAFPSRWRPIVSSMPWMGSGDKSVKAFGNMAVAAITRRLAEIRGQAQAKDENSGETDGAYDGDMLEKLLKGRDDEGKPLSPNELSSEAVSLLGAGSDTTANSSCAITYYVARDPYVQMKLRAELDNALGLPSVSTSDFVVPSHDVISRLPYLEAVVNEGLRVHTTLGAGLPRVVPPEGITVLGQTLPMGAVVSVPSYLLHHSPDIWGADAEEFRPERWEEGNKEQMANAFIPFSTGPRACVGRNLAKMELLIFIATVFWRYDVVLEEPGKRLEVLDALLRKPLSCKIGLKRRDM